MGYAGADTAGEDKPGEHRSELEDHRLDDHPARHIERQLARELVAGLEAGHGAGEPGHEQHDEETAVADRHGLLDGTRQPDAPFQDAADQVEDEKKEAPRVAGAM